MREMLPLNSYVAKLSLGEKEILSLPSPSVQIFVSFTINSHSMSTHARGTELNWPLRWLMSFIKLPKESISAFLLSSLAPLLVLRILPVAMHFPLDIWWPRSPKLMVFVFWLQRSLYFQLLLASLTYHKCISSNKCRVLQKRKNKKLVLNKHHLQLPPLRQRLTAIE